MLGKTDRQGEFFRADYLYLDHVGAGSIYAFLSEARYTCFRDEDFAGLFRDGGRPGVPPSQLCVALLLQTLEGVSDQEAIARTAYDLRWKVALSLHPDEKLCAKSTLQLFRAKLIVHDQYAQLFDKSVEACRRAGKLKRGKLEVAIDSTPVLGRGAVKDTYNLISDQIRCVLTEVACLLGADRGELVAQHGLGRHFAASFKGAVDLDWDDQAQRRALIGQLVADAQVALEVGRTALKEASDLAADSPLTGACKLLEELLLQDVELEPEDGEGPRLVQGTRKDRIISTTDPEMRHGRKSPTKTINGYKATVVADTESGVILETTVAPANQSDGSVARAAIEGAQERVSGDIERSAGDTAYGTVKARQEVEALGIEVVAKAPPAGARKGFFTIDDFEIDKERGVATCPAGRTSAVSRPTRCAENGPGFRYEFAKSDCEACPLRAKCTTAANGRSIRITEVTEIQQEYRKQQRTPEFKEKYRRRVVIEHRIARLVQLGIRQARYLGRGKVAFQVAMAAIVANLTAAAASVEATANTSSALLAALEAQTQRLIRHLLESGGQLRRVHECVRSLCHGPGVFSWRRQPSARCVLSAG